MQQESEFVVETHRLEFSFKKEQPLLKNLNLQVKKGTIYGFLGPNGSGKTTTIRLLLGLLKGGEQSISLFGKSLARNRRAILSRVGALIEQPSLYEHLTGFENLEIVRRLKRLDAGATACALERVGLTEASRKVVKTYSLGMKQRLGIALALLGEPELLILDEPVNGLDPGGMVDIRNLLLEMNRTCGTTIFISSHLLPEVEKLVSEVGIIHMGQLLFQGSIRELRALQGENVQLLIETNQPEAALKVLRPTYKAIIENGAVLVEVPSKEAINPLLGQLIDSGINIFSVTGKDRDLEGWFIQMTQGHVVR